MLGVLGGRTAPTMGEYRLDPPALTALACSSTVCPGEAATVLVSVVCGAPNQAPPLIRYWTVYDDAPGTATQVNVADVDVFDWNVTAGVAGGRTAMTMGEYGLDPTVFTALACSSIVCPREAVTVFVAAVCGALTQAPPLIRYWTVYDDAHGTFAQANVADVDVDDWSVTAGTVGMSGEMTIATMGEYRLDPPALTAFACSSTVCPGEAATVFVSVGCGAFTQAPPLIRYWTVYDDAPGTAAQANVADVGVLACKDTTGTAGMRVTEGTFDQVDCSAPRMAATRYRNDDPAAAVCQLGMARSVRVTVFVAGPPSDAHAAPFHDHSTT
jgi:hypothetical protein